MWFLLSCLIKNDHILIRRGKAENWHHAKVKNLTLKIQHWFLEIVTMITGLKQSCKLRCL